ncbi:MAG: hypothetical protein HY352_03480 [Candidatus Omnitrophica bacterium]|nr:hypothetical protein [Candidatus Omnitrophota bacterium]
MEALLTLAALYGAFVAISWFLRVLDEAKQYRFLKPRLDQVDRLEIQLRTNQEAWNKQVADDKQALDAIAKEKSLGFPWLADAYAEYFHIGDLKAAQHLEWKSHPARKAAEEVRRIAKERRIAEKLWRVLKYQLEYYETLFPWLVDFKAEDIDDLVRQLTQKKSDPSVSDYEDDPVKHWLTESEYQSLGATERNQLALNRYWKKKKSKWELGRDYERFVGYKYETEGWEVRYQGIIEGMEDLGRDLIVSRGERIKIVQCKYWSKEKLIHEKHVFQLHGSTIAYKLDHPNTNVSATLVTSTNLSERAKQFAGALGISILEIFPLQEYPCIKCNISRRDGEKIYHLPFDQQYDRTIIEKERMEKCVSTVKEAEELGFRRAWKWHGK